MNKTIILAIALLSGACASGSGRYNPAADLAAADLAAAADAQATSVTEVFQEILSFDGVLFTPAPVNGLTFLKSNPLPASMLMRWTPVHAETSANQLIGYTTGVFEFGPRDGAPVERGDYLTIWHREGGTWRVMADASVTTIPASSVDEARGRHTTKTGLNRFKVDEVLLLSYDDNLNADHTNRLAMYGSPQIKLMRPGHPASKTLEEAISIAGKTPGSEWTRTRLHIPVSGDVAYSYGTRKVGTELRGWLRVYRMTNMAQWKLLLELAN